jgi:hypothetical protein
LAEKLDGRLSPILLLQGHVHIIHKHYKLLAKWWAKHSCNKKNILKQFVFNIFYFKDCNLLGHNKMQSDGCALIFQRNILSPSSG